MVLMPHMSQSKRKLIGAFLLVGSIVAWSVLGTMIYLALPEGLPPLVLVGYFLIAGMGWVLPAAQIIKWMARPDRQTSNG